MTAVASTDTMRRNRDLERDLIIRGARPYGASVIEILALQRSRIDAGGGSVRIRDFDKEFKEELADATAYAAFRVQELRTNDRIPRDVGIVLEERYVSAVGLVVAGFDHVANAGRLYTKFVLHG